MSTAVISACGQYRYRLTRRLTEPPVLFPHRFVLCMLNPSTADAELDDPTIRRCKGFALRERRDELVVVNLYALRSTDPRGLWQHADPVGPENDAAIIAAARSTRAGVVCAWGAHARLDRVVEVVKLLRRIGVPLLCLGTTKDGHPRHPLMLPNDVPLQPYAPEIG